MHAQALLTTRLHAGVDVILGCNGMVWVAPHARAPELGADGEPDQAPPPPPATSAQREAVCRVAGAVRALAALYFPIFSATLVDTFQACSRGTRAGQVTGTCRTCSASALLVL